MGPRHPVKTMGLELEGHGKMIPILPLLMQPIRALAGAIGFFLTIAAKLRLDSIFFLRFYVWI